MGAQDSETGVGSNFVSNYPPYSFWSADALPAVDEALNREAQDDAVLGLYLHIPFCRKRCKFCYFRVYTDKNSAEVERYLDGLVREAELLAARRAIEGRELRFVYFGGGTPSFISARHLRSLMQRLRDTLPMQGAEEITFECEPGTLTRAKLEAIRDIGVTRLSLGVENFDDEILAENGRAHVSKEIYRVLPWIDQLDFPQVNIDLIAGMVGETWDSWRDTVQKTIDADPDYVTIYQMELPFNTVYSKQVLDGSRVGVADWPTKRDWHRYAIEQMEQAGYAVSSAYTLVKRGAGATFVYRDLVWRGCDLLGIGVSSFSHVQGVHYQNSSAWTPYLERVEAGELPLERAFRTSPEERLTREMILQLKEGRIRPAEFERKFGAKILDRFAVPFGELAGRGLITLGEDEIRLSRDALLRVDQLLPVFYAAEYQNARYT